MSHVQLDKEMNENPYNVKRLFSLQMASNFPVFQDDALLTWKFLTLLFRSKRFHMFYS